MYYLLHHKKTLLFANVSEKDCYFKAVVHQVALVLLHSTWGSQDKEC